MSTQTVDSDICQFPDADMFWLLPRVMMCPDLGKSELLEGGYRTARGADFGSKNNGDIQQQQQAVIHDDRGYGRHVAGLNVKIERAVSSHESPAFSGHLSANRCTCQPLITCGCAAGLVPFPGRTRVTETIVKYSFLFSHALWPRWVPFVFLHVVRQPRYLVVLMDLLHQQAAHPTIAVRLSVHERARNLQTIVALRSKRLAGEPISQQKE
jgi:hypothetical protein